MCSRKSIIRGICLSFDEADECLDNNQHFIGKAISKGRLKPRCLGFQTAFWFVGLPNFRQSFFDFGLHFRSEAATEHFAEIVLRRVVDQLGCFDNIAGNAVNAAEIVD